MKRFAKTALSRSALVAGLVILLLLGCRETPVNIPPPISRTLGVDSGKNRAMSLRSELIWPDIKKAAAKEKRLALVIGNADYYPASARLKNPVNDAKDMRLSLKELSFDVDKHENANQMQMRQAIDGFSKKLDHYNVGLFFYAGHGMQIKGKNYLIPVDFVFNKDTTREKDVEERCISAEYVLGKMEDGGNDVNIIVLDACRDNPCTRSLSRSLTRGSGKGVATRGLASMNASAGSLIAYSTSPGNVAEDGSGRNGLYTSALLRHMKDANITILEMFQRVRFTVREKTGNQQTPWETTSLMGNFYLNFR